VCDKVFLFVFIFEKKNLTHWIITETYLLFFGTFFVTIWLLLDNGFGVLMKIFYCFIANWACGISVLGQSGDGMSLVFE
jgi:hypothetical protein